MSPDKRGKILVTGGAGYIGARLVPRLLAEGFDVRVFDLYIFGEQSLDLVKENPNLEQIKGDIRDQKLLKKAIEGCNSIIHLVSIANDPKKELDPELGKSINYEAFIPLIRSAKASGIGRFIYTSSTSVYGISEAPAVDETHPQAPISDYSKFKSMCEAILFENQDANFTTVAIRPGVVNGYSPRQRLELLVNRFVAEAVIQREIIVQGGGEIRPQSHIEDMVDLYCLLLKSPAEKIAGKSFNATNENYLVREVATIVRDIVTSMIPVDKPITLTPAAVRDARSYAISSEKLKRELGFACKRTVQDAVTELVEALQAGKLPDALSDPRYYNIKGYQNSALGTSDAVV